MAHSNELCVQHTDVTGCPSVLPLQSKFKRFSGPAGACLSRFWLQVTPEHRLSLQLKWHELRHREDHALSDQLRAVSKVPVYDFLDECDEILRHKYQLVYAVGATLPLADGPDRWHTAQAILRVIEEDPQVFGNSFGGSYGSVQTRLPRDMEHALVCVHARACVCFRMCVCLCVRACACAMAFHGRRATLNMRTCLTVFGQQRRSPRFNTTRISCEDQNTPPPPPL